MEQKQACEYCGHIRCDTCLPDRWPNLADGAARVGVGRWLGCWQAKQASAGKCPGFTDRGCG
jgi:hypothetical protein